MPAPEDRSFDPRDLEKLDDYFKEPLAQVDEKHQQQAGELAPDLGNEGRNALATVLQQLATFFREGNRDQLLELVITRPHGLVAMNVRKHIQDRLPAQLQRPEITDKVVKFLDG